MWTPCRSGSGAAALPALDRFLEAGGTLVDTADVYGDGRSEEIIGRWFASRPPDLTEPVVLATKGRFSSSPPDGAGLSARHLTRALDASLRRLGRDERRGTARTWHVIDAVQKVAGDRGMPMAEVAIAWVTARPGRQLNHPRRPDREPAGGQPARLRAAAVTGRDRRAQRRQRPAPRRLPLHRARRGPALPHPAARPLSNGGDPPIVGGRGQSIHNHMPLR
jgi:Aldo/keto reductase family